MPAFYVYRIIYSVTLTEVSFQTPHACIILCLLCIFISQICLWKVLKKRPVATIKQAHDGEGEVWISALRALRNTDLLASGTSSLLQ